MKVLFPHFATKFYKINKNVFQQIHEPVRAP